MSSHLGVRQGVIELLYESCRPMQSSVTISQQFWNYFLNRPTTFFGKGCSYGVDSGRLLLDRETIVPIGCVLVQTAQWRNYVRSALRHTFPRRPSIPWGPKECQNYNCLSHPLPPGTQAIEMTEAKEITYSRACLSYHSGIKTLKSGDVLFQPKVKKTIQLPECEFYLHCSILEWLLEDFDISITIDDLVSVHVFQASALNRQNG